MAHLRMKTAAPRRGLTRIAATRQSLRALLLNTTTTTSRTTSATSTSHGMKTKSRGVVLESVPSLVDQVESMDEEDDDMMSSTAEDDDDDTSTASSAYPCVRLQDGDHQIKRLRRRPFRWIPAYLCRSMPSLLDEEMIVASAESDLPSDSFIGVAPFPSSESTEDFDTASSTSSSKGSTDSAEEEDDEAWRHQLADEVTTERRVRFAPMVKKIQYQRYTDTEAVWWTRDDRRRTIEEASNEINVYIRQFPETFRTIILLCHNEMRDYTTLKQIMPVRGLLRPCLNRLSRDDAMVRTWVQKARKSVSYIVRLQASEIAIAHYTSYSIAASRMASYVAQADARAAVEEHTVLVDPTLLSRASSETMVGPSERITV